MDSAGAQTADAHGATGLIDAERGLLARELHDGLGQTLISIHLLASLGSGDEAGGRRASEQLEQLAALSREAAERIRGLSRCSDPALRGTLEDALRTLADDLALRFQAPSACTVAADLPPLTAAAALAVYRAFDDAVRALVSTTSIRRVDVYGEVEDGRLCAALALACSGEVTLAPDRGHLALARRRAEAAGGVWRAQASGRRVRFSCVLPAGGAGAGDADGAGADGAAGR